MVGGKQCFKLKHFFLNINNFLQSFTNLLFYFVLLLNLDNLISNSMWVGSRFVRETLGGTHFVRETLDRFSFCTGNPVSVSFNCGLFMYLILRRLQAMDSSLFHAHNLGICYCTEGTRTLVGKND